MREVVEVLALHPQEEGFDRGVGSEDPGPPFDEIPGS